MDIFKVKDTLGKEILNNYLNFTLIYHINYNINNSNCWLIYYNAIKSECICLLLINLNLFRLNAKIIKII